VYKRQEFVIVTQDGQYANYIKFQLTQDRCGLIDPYDEGHDIKVSFDLRGREWNEKFFTNLNAWRIQDAGQAQAPPAAGNEPFGAQPPLENIKENAADKLSDDPFDDLPF